MRLILCLESGRIVQFLKDITLSVLQIGQLVGQVRTEGFEYWEDDASVLREDGAVGDEIEETVSARNRIVVVVEFVHVHHPDQQLIVQVALGQKWNGHSGLVVHVEHVQAEILLIQLISIQAVYVFHHQIPDRGLDVEDGALEHLGHQGLWRIDPIVGKFTDLIYPAVHGVLEGHGQHFILIQRLVQCDETELWIEAVFIRIQFAGIGQFNEFSGFLIAGRVQQGVGLRDVANAGQILRQAGRIQSVVAVGGRGAVLRIGAWPGKDGWTGEGIG